MKIANLRFADNESLPKLGTFLYPSAECGPLSTEKAKRLINWRSTKLEKAIEISNQFYLNSGPCFRYEFDLVSRQFHSLMQEYSAPANHEPKAKKEPNEDSRNQEVK